MIKNFSLFNNNLFFLFEKTNQHRFSTFAAKSKKTVVKELIYNYKLRKSAIAAKRRSAIRNVFYKYKVRKAAIAANKKIESYSYSLFSYVPTPSSNNFLKKNQKTTIKYLYNSRSNRDRKAYEEDIDTYLDTLLTIRKIQDKKNIKYLKNNVVYNSKTGDSVSLSDVFSNNRKAEVSNLISSFLEYSKEKDFITCLMTYTLKSEYNHDYNSDITRSDFFNKILSQYEMFNKFVNDLNSSHIFKRTSKNRDLIYVNKKEDFIHITMFELTKNYNIHVHQAIFTKKEYMYHLVNEFARIARNNAHIGAVDCNMSKADSEYIFNKEMTKQLKNDGRKEKYYDVEKSSGNFETGQIFTYSILADDQSRSEDEIKNSIARYVAKYVAKNANNTDSENKYSKEYLIFSLLKKKPFRYSQGVIFPLSIYRKSAATLLNKVIHILDFSKFTIKNNRTLLEYDYKKNIDACFKNKENIKNKRTFLYYLQKLIREKKIKLNKSYVLNLMHLYTILDDYVFGKTYKCNYFKIANNVTYKADYLYDTNTYYCQVSVKFSSRYHTKKNTLQVIEIQSKEYDIDYKYDKAQSSITVLNRRDFEQYIDCFDDESKEKIDSNFAKFEKSESSISSDEILYEDKTLFQKINEQKKLDSLIDLINRNKKKHIDDFIKFFDKDLSTNSFDLDFVLMHSKIQEKIV